MEANSQFGEVLEFLLNSFRAKLTICSKNTNNSSVVEECPFNFNHFLVKGNESVFTSDQIKFNMLRDLKSIQREGLLDSIIPYLISFTRQSSLNRARPSSLAAITAAGDNTSTSISIAVGSKEKVTEPKHTAIDYPIVIHVSDELKGVHQDFQCQQSILVQEMGYFTLIIGKGQKLHDMDITIHCDLTIFEWLMRWIWFSTRHVQEAPVLDAINVVGLTVSADFLQMPVLKETCLKFLYDHIQLVIANSPNLGCLSDSLLAQFAQKFDIVELETIISPVDRLDRITSKLYTQFILSLNNSVPNGNIGHYASTASLFQCKLCEQLVTNEVAIKVLCTCVKFDGQGKLYSCHEKNDSWTLGNFIIGLKRELKTWRKVYWRLWGTIHFFQCATCKIMFSGSALKYCRYHPENPRFVVELEEPINISPKNGAKLKSDSSDSGQKEYTYKPFGKYPCCKTTTYKYLTSPDLSGCQRKEHTVSKSTGASEVLDKFHDLIVIEPDKHSKDVLCNSIIQLSIDKSPMPINLTPSTSAATTARTDELHETAQQASFEALDTSNESSMDSDEEQLVPPMVRTSRLPYLGAPHQDTWIWNKELSTRYNQDMQREMEEKLMLNLCSFLSQRIPIDNNFDAALSQFTNRNTKLHGCMNQENSGSFVGLEQMWLDEQTKQNVRGSSNSNIN